MPNLGHQNRHKWRGNNDLQAPDEHRYVVATKRSKRQKPATMIDGGKPNMYKYTFISHNQ